MDRKGSKDRETTEQPRYSEGAMPRTHQRVISRRRMQQRVEAFADDTQNCHGSRALRLCVEKTRRNAALPWRQRVRVELNER